MGALHDGHLSLVERCVKENDVCVVSVFVNPTQFNDKHDLETYPRTLDKDCTLLEPVGCDYVFAPSAEEMYPERLDPELAKNAVRFESDCDGCGEGNDGACEK